MFGTGVSVKLDLFHAIQRITKTLRKKNPLLHECLQNLRLVFRQDGDSEKKRMADTPGPDVMLYKLDRFVEKWKSVKDCNGRSIFTSDTLGATEKLKHHISSGCLSNIPPGAGTNRNL